MDRVITADGIHYKVLNDMVWQAVSDGAKRIILEDVVGQRYIGCGLKGEDVEIIIRGVPGNDLAAFMDGPRIIVEGNAQDGVGNTMNAGEVIVHGNAGDIIGYAMRGGRIFVKGNVGYRVGIHMKAYRDLFPVIVIGGVAGDFLGEYMAGGLLIVLGLGSEEKDIVGDFVGTGMHGGNIFIRGGVKNAILGKEVGISLVSEDDMTLIRKHIEDFCNHFSFDIDEVLSVPFFKLYPHSHRPYGKLYAY
ncbi:MAG: hypothetical protein H5T91_02835 [Synergistetes bacterium]|nr:hypothetical protein [Synergistota bacterium]